MKHYHLMGIGGISMSGLARILRKDGHMVSGCDSQLSDLTRHLEREGIRVYLGHSPAHLEGVDVLVASTAIPDSEPELATAQTLGLPVWRRIQVVAEILRGGYSLGVTGSHGKTSTTSMLASIFVAAQTDPTVLLGAELGLIGGSAKVGSGRYRIAEVDESDPLFRFLELDLAVLTNLEPDHVSPDGQARPNYHTSFEALQDAVGSFAGRARHIIYNGEPRWQLLDTLTQGRPRSSFGLLAGDCHAKEIALEPFGSRFELVWQGQVLGPVRLQVPGEHNITNALAASAAALVAGIPFEAIQQGLYQFTGASRRFEKIGELNGALIVDDYAHNATKLFVLLKAARNTGLRVRAVFQPHRYGRSEQEWPLYAQALEQADETLLLDVYAAGETPLQLTSAQIAQRMLEHLSAKGCRASHQSWDSTLDYLRQSAAPGDLILTIGAGSVSRLGRLLAAEKEAV
ncbi:UDP-N-acetylmuramate--L-alanine ligase [Meiothermus sp.]|uniref:UDP-N-acetylmuramate--L-alanine ligase n=1 Tax=Meiothermus sp. TaxID=1955249 RepID=UPI00307F6089